MTKEKKILKTILKVGKRLGVGLTEQEKKLIRKKEMKRLRYRVERAEQIQKLERTKSKIRKARLEAREDITNRSETNIKKILKEMPE